MKRETTRWATAFQSDNQNLTRDDISQGKNQKINFKTFENEFIRNKIECALKKINKFIKV